MKNSLIAILCFVGIFSGLHSLHAQEVNTILEKVRSKLNLVKDYQANGTMKLNVSFLKVPDSKVTIFYKQPDKFRIKQEKGISLVPKGGININLNSMLSNGKYTAVDAGTSIIARQQVKVIKLLPLDEESDVVLSTLYIDTNNFLVKKAINTTKENGSYVVEFTYQKYRDWALPDELVFSFNTKDYKLPKGMTFDYEDDDTKIDTTKVKNSKGEVRITFQNYVINKGVSDGVFK